MTPFSIGGQEDSCLKLDTQPGRGEEARAAAAAVDRELAQWLTREQEDCYDTINVYRMV